MLTDSRIIKYYGFISRFWTGKRDSAQYNVDQDFAVWALEQHERAKTMDDTPVNQTLFEIENVAHAEYVLAVSRAKVNIVTQDVVDQALLAFQDAKQARRQRVPNPEWITSVITKRADQLFTQIQQQYNEMQDANSELAIIRAKAVVDATADFASRLAQWIELASAAEEQTEYSGEPPSERYNTLESYGLFSDGNYGDEINRVSPEGYFYGDTTMIQKIPHKYWWSGRKWLRIPEVLDQASDSTLLPNGKPFGEIWRAQRYVDQTNEYVWDHYVSLGDGNWAKMRQYWDVNDISELPATGFRIGDWHTVIERDVPVYWSGEGLRRFRLASFEGRERIDDLEELTGDFITSMQPGFELIYISSQELSLRPIENDFDFIRVNGQNIEASKRTSVFTFTPILGWNAEAGALYWSSLQPDTDYYVYLANRSDGFNLAVYDFRGRLFCSGTAPVNGKLGDDGLAENAILIGQAETAGDGGFRYELDVSLISRQSDLNETFREFSDFNLKWTDQTTLSLVRFYGAYGQIYVPESLYYLGDNLQLTNTDSRIEMDDDELLVYTTAALDPGSLYYVYIGGNTDIYNFNDINPATNRPWHDTDEGSDGQYESEKDFRLRIFLSSKTPEDGRMAQTYYGFWTRHIGQVFVDNSRYFKFSNDISSIRAMLLNPTDFSGLAEISLQTASSTQFKIFCKPGTSGVVYVNDSPVRTFRVNDPLCHAINNTDPVYSYDEESISSPLKITGHNVSYYKQQELHIYMANGASHWGLLANKLFACVDAPDGGYVSQNWPGVTARWILTIWLPQSGLLTGSYVINSIMGAVTGIDDFNTSVSTTYSSQKIFDSFPPAGTVVDFAGPTPPSGWLICNGQSVTVLAYPNLFTAIGYTYGGSGDTFNVPNLNSRTTIGYDGRWAMGSVVGGETHTLTPTEMPSHNHGGQTGTYGMFIRSPMYLMGGGSMVPAPWTGGDHSHSISSEGGSQPHNNMQPSMCLWKIIKC